MFIRIFLILSIGILISGCSRSDLGPAPTPENYEADFEAWEADRHESLTNPTGWMRLAGMYWLVEGEQVFGSGDEVDIQFPEGTIPQVAGTIRLENGEVTLISDEEVAITHDGKPVSEMVVYDGENAPEIEYGSLNWVIIERGDLIGIRLFNKENSKVDEFTGFPRYDIKPEWHVKARFIQNPEGATIPIINVLGQLEQSPSPGVLEFELDGENFTLDTIEGTTRLFVILGDETNQTETYQAGRYLYIDYPDEGSEYTVIDFNKAYNPPCAYSKFTTCQLPPMQNRLATEITAGEKRPVDWDGL